MPPTAGAVDLRDHDAAEENQGIGRNDQAGFESRVSGASLGPSRTPNSQEAGEIFSQLLGDLITG
jgi:hypothetical protein